MEVAPLYVYIDTVYTVDILYSVDTVETFDTVRYCSNCFTQLKTPSEWADQLLFKILGKWISGWTGYGLF